MPRRIAVITPVCGPADRCMATMQSVLASHSCEIDYIVVGDVARLQGRFETGPRQRLIRWLESDSSDVYALINDGLRQTDAPIVSWLIPGDRLFDDSIAIVGDYLSRHADVEVVYGDATGIDGDANPFAELKAKEWSRFRLRHDCFFRQPTVYLRRGVIELAGLLDPELGRWADYDLWLRLADLGTHFSHLPRLIAAQRVDPARHRLWPTDEKRCLADLDDFNRILERHRLTPSTRYLAEYGLIAAAEKLPASTDLTELVVEAEQFAMSLASRVRGRGILPSILTPFIRCQVGKLLRKGSAARAAYSGHERQSTRSPRPVRLQAFRKRISRHFHHDPRPMHVPAQYLRTQPPPQPPLISIVTPSFNQARYLGATLRSVLDQKYPRLEYIVQDGGSGDGSVEILHEYSSLLTAWESKADGGQTQAINLGMRRTTGEIMAYLNSDDLLLPGSLAYVASYFDEHPEADVVYGHRVLIDEQGFEIGRWVLPPHDDQVIALEDFIPQETMFWRRRAWDAVGGYVDESFQFAMDWDLILRFRSAGMCFVRLPRFLGAFRITDTQKTKAMKWWLAVGRRETERLTSRALGQTPSRSQVRRRLRPYLRRHFVLDKLYLAGLIQY